MPKIFGIPFDDKVEFRKTVVAVVYYPQDKKFLYLHRPNYGFDCLVSGGIENQEQPLEGIKREILEETGFVNFRIIGSIGEEVQTYYIDKKGVKKAKHINAFFVILDDLEKIDHNREEDEDFDVKFEDGEKIIELFNTYHQDGSIGVKDHIYFLEEAILQYKL